MFLDDTFLPIASAPRNGVLVVVGHEKVGTFALRLSGTMTNSVFACMWLASDDSITWRDDQDGPTQLKPRLGKTGILH